MMRYEVLRAADDPCQVADAERVGLGERSSERQTRRIGETASPFRSLTQSAGLLVRSRSDRLGQRKIKTEQVAATICGHRNILTAIDMSRTFLALFLAATVPAGAHGGWGGGAPPEGTPQRQGRDEVVEAVA